MSLKIEFVERATKAGAKLAPLCREFGISRPTGTTWLRRFREEGYAGLEERSRRPASSPLTLAEQLVMAVLELRDRYPNWGPKKLRPLLLKRYVARRLVHADPACAQIGTARKAVRASVFPRRDDDISRAHERAHDRIERREIGADADRHCDYSHEEAEDEGHHHPRGG
jgi:hypothetical protein